MADGRRPGRHGGRLLYLTLESTSEKVRVVPAEYRTRDVQVGRHVPVSPGAVPRFTARFEEAYSKLARTDTILAAATAHHRLAWIHPFIDGNGRVMRLMSYAVLRETLDTGASGRSQGALPAMSRNTRAISPPAICPAATISMAAAT